MATSRWPRAPFAQPQYGKNPALSATGDARLKVRNHPARGRKFRGTVHTRTLRGVAPPVWPTGPSTLLGVWLQMCASMVGPDRAGMVGPDPIGLIGFIKLKI